MNNYEKIMLALFAIQHNAHIIHSSNEAYRMIGKQHQDLIDLANGRDNLLGSLIEKLRDVMEELGECVNAMDGVTACDSKLMEVPYAIVYGRKTPEDYE